MLCSRRAVCDLDGSWNVDFAGAGIPLRSPSGVPRCFRRGWSLARGGKLEVEVSCDFLISCMTMAVAIRGPAAARFYKTFHAWSRLGSVSHQQRRCFVQTGPACEATHARPANWRQDAQHVRTSGAQNKQDDLEPQRIQNTGHGRKQNNIYVREPRFALMQQHPTFLDRMQAELDIKLTPAECPTENGQRHILVESPSSHTFRYVRTILRRPYEVMQDLDNFVFNHRTDARAGATDLDLNLPSATARFLQDNDDELRLRIQKAFSVEVNIRSFGPRTTAFISGADRDNVISARDFINSIDLGSVEPSQSQQDQPERPLATSPKPSSLPSPPTQSSPRPIPQSVSQSSLQSEPTNFEDAHKPSLKDDYKATMRSVPSSVVVLTTRVPSAEPNIDSLRGMTLSSLSSITLEPEPIISFSIRGPSRTLDCIIAGQPFTANFLKTHPTAASIADIFSKPHDDPSQPFRAILASDWVESFDDQASPAIKSDHVPARFTCQLLPGKSLDVGDHTVVFARVTQIWRATSVKSSKPPRTFLAYAQAGYRSLHGNQIPLTSVEPQERAQPVKPILESDQKVSKDTLDRRIVIDGFPHTVQAKEVGHYLQNAGFNISRLKSNVVGCRNTGSFRVKFDSVEDGERAVRTLDGADFMGHSLKVSHSLKVRVAQETPTPVPQRPQSKATTEKSQILDESLSTGPSLAEPASTQPASTKATSTESAFTELPFTELASNELSSTNPTSTGSGEGDVVDAYWRMALDEDNEDDVLEERAADQRALGEAQKPVDHPAANTEGNKQDN